MQIHAKNANIQAPDKFQPKDGLIPLDRETGGLTESETKKKTESWSKRIERDRQIDGNK